MIICLETSTDICSVALCNSEGILSLKESTENKSHAAQLTVFIEELLSEAGIRAADLEAVAVSKGPGSYTGLRIGVSTAKGITYAASVPLIGIETTYSMFCGINTHLRDKYRIDSKSLLVPMIDARRMEVYYSILSSDGRKVREIFAEIINGNTFADIPEPVRLLIFGTGASKCHEVIRRGNVAYAEEFRISAAFMHEPAYKALRNKEFEDIAYFEPFYLKDFITSRPKKNILGR